MATETRVFESVDSSPETQAANKAYFEAQGVTHEATASDAADTQPPPVDDPAKPAGAAPVVVDGEADLDELEQQVEQSAAADGGAASHDGKKKENSVARVRRERRELKVERDELKAKADKLERDLADAKAGKPNEPPAPGTPPAGSPAAAAPAAEAGALATEVFPEAEPKEPQYEDFAAEEDQLLAYQRATTKYAKDWGRWDRKREAFDVEAANKAAAQTTQVQQRKTERLTKLNERLVEVRAEYADFDATLKNGDVLSPALSAASTVVPGGLKAAYLLAKDPVKLKEFNEKTAASQKVNGRDVPTQDAYDLALYLLGQATGSAPPGAPAAAASPAASIPSAPTPREEAPAPTPARGRAEPPARRSDLSGDARRDMLARELTQ